MTNRARPALSVLYPVLFVFFAASCTTEASSLPPPPAALKITMRELAFEVDRPLVPGRVVVTLENAGTVEHQLAVVKLAPDVPPLAEQLRGETRRGSPSIVTLVRRPGTTTTFALDLEAGRYGLLCFMRDTDGVQHAYKGMNAELRVS